MRKDCFPELTHTVDVCVVGGGMAGLCAALAAARHGAKTVLMHDRPVLGGNASSECRVHICGADIHNSHKNIRETGILEELRLENLWVNRQRSFSVWDTVLYEMEGNTMASVTGWQLTTQTRHLVRAKIFADCFLAPLTGATCRIGREARHEFGGSKTVRDVTILLDSALAQNVQLSYHQRDDQLTQRMGS